jgi:hypothetical protein
VIHEVVLKACDELDGVKDGQLENPLICRFDPKVLLCKGADVPDCLTSAQFEFLQKTYQRTSQSRTGEVIFPGPAMGDELGEMYRFVTGRENGTQSLERFGDPKAKIAAPASIRRIHKGSIRRAHCLRSALK